VIAFDSIAGWRDERDRQIHERLTLGLVPTMGAIHEGHLAAVRLGDVRLIDNAAVNR
jgi:pantothenate synthetase